MTKSRLGRGLDALLGGESAAIGEMERKDVPLEVIEENPHQPRKTFDEDELASLSDSIRNHGVLQPLVVRQVGEKFQVVAGERRLRAARTAGLVAVPVTVVNFNDQQVLEAALVENIQRTDLNPIEKAQGFKEYLSKYQMTHEQLAARLGLGRATITNLVSLLDLPQELQDAVRVGQLSTGHAKVLKGIGDAERQQSLCKEIITRGLSVHAAEALIKQGANPTQEKEPESKDAGEARHKAENGHHIPEGKKTEHVQRIEDDLRQKMGLRVEIRVKAKDKGQVILGFDSQDDFDRILGFLQK